MPDNREKGGRSGRWQRRENRRRQERRRMKKHGGGLARVYATAVRKRFRRLKK